MVRSVIFNGAQIHYGGETGFGEMLAIQSSFAEARHFPSGAAVTLCWPRGVGFLLRDEG